MSQLQFNEDQRKEIKDIIEDVLYKKEFAPLELLNNMERKLDHNIDNLSSTQRVIIEKISGVRSLVELNYEAIKKNRDEILENRNLIEQNHNLIEENGDQILENRDLIKQNHNILNEIKNKLD